MALRSKLFVYKRKGKDGAELDFHASDTWYPTNVDYKWNESTDKLAVGGYYGSTSGLHTIAFTLRNFIGRIIVQGTLASEPSEMDWFPIKVKKDQDYLEFTDNVIYQVNTDTLHRERGTTGTYAENIQGNFTYMRVLIERDYISTNPTQEQKQIAGHIEEILINF